MKKNARKLFDECMQKYSPLQSCAKDILCAFDSLVNCFSQGGKVLVCGNGGSAADAEHIVSEFMKKFRIKRSVDPLISQKLVALGFDFAEHLASQLERALPAISLVSHSSLITAIVNDIGGDMIFAQQVYGYGKAGDVLLALSTSGNSSNVLTAIKVARALDMTVIGFTSETGGKMKPICNVNVCVPDTVTFQVQELHLPVYHLLCAMVEEEMFGTDSVNT
jgi:D-sedoheptulose 7-phosphate isomerase